MADETSMRGNLPAAERAAEESFNIITRTATSYEGLIARIDPQLRPEAIAERARKTRDDARADLGPRLLQMRRAAEEAKALIREYTPEAFRRKARFAGDDATNATMQLAAHARLARTPTGELLETLRDAITDGKVAMAETVRLEFMARQDRDRFNDDFAAIFGTLKHPEVEESHRALERIQGLAGLADQRFLELTRGHSDPIARITAARQLGQRRAA